jgi:Toastrack DUF4097
MKLPALLVLAMCATGCVALDAGAPVTDQQEKRFSVTGRPDVTLSTFDGRIDVRAWDRSEVLVVVERRASSEGLISTIQVDTRQDGNRITVTARRPSHLNVRFGWGPGATLTVYVPSAADVRATSGDGRIDVDGVKGSVTLRSRDGSIHASHLSGSTSVESGDGHLSLNAIEGALSAETHDGRIDAEGTFTSLRLYSGDGRIRVLAQRGSTVQGDWDVTTRDGGVVVELAEAIDADLDARTSDGRIRLDGIALTDVAEMRGRRALRGRLGAGGLPLRVRTGDGSITFRRY